MIHHHNHDAASGPAKAGSQDHDHHNHDHHGHDHHGHDHATHGHAHSHDHGHAVADTVGWSLLRASLTARLAIAAGASLMAWALIGTAFA